MGEPVALRDAIGCKSSLASATRFIQYDLNMQCNTFRFGLVTALFLSMDAITSHVSSQHPRRLDLACAYSMDIIFKIMRNESAIYCVVTNTKQHLC